jgi:hypothetical protein
MMKNKAVVDDVRVRTAYLSREAVQFFSGCTHKTYVQFDDGIRLFPLPVFELGPQPL